METGEKPFPCKIDGCKLSFTTEDHLNVHRNKHDMKLNLDIPNKSNLFADQTPTPTRLIGKCDEVGLFEDLQNVNPFEETFRRAVEEKSAGICNSTSDRDLTALVSVGAGDDTLHTPHVLPLLERRESIKERALKPSKLIISRSGSRKDDVSTIYRGVRLTVNEQVLSEGAEALIRAKRKLPHDKIVGAKKKSFVNILPKAVIPEAPVINMSCAKDDMVPLVKTITELNPVKGKLRQHLVRNCSSVESKDTLHPASKKFNMQPAIAIRTIKPEEKSISINADRMSALQKHERWNAASKRYRARAKMNQDTLHRKNEELKEENLRLKTEVARLKSALSLHRDCSVTRALSAVVDSNVAGTSKVVVNSAPQPVPLQQPHTIAISIPSDMLIASHVVDHPAVHKSPVYIVIDGTGTLNNNTCGTKPH